MAQHRSRPETLGGPAISATDAKNAFGRMLEFAGRQSCDTQLTEGVFDLDRGVPCLANAPQIETEALG
jgi:hypothetical protein